METFIGRQQELKKLEDTTQFQRASLVVIRGRRRVGKSRLVAEFAKNKIFFPFTGLAPIKSMRATEQLKAFSYQLATNLGCSLPPDFIVT